MSWPLSRDKVLARQPTAAPRLYRVRGQSRLVWWIETPNPQGIWSALTPGMGYRTQSEAVTEALRLAQAHGATFIDAKEVGE